MQEQRIEAVGQNADRDNLSTTECAESLVTRLDPQIAIYSRRIGALHEFYLGLPNVEIGTMSGIFWTLYICCRGVRRRWGNGWLLRVNILSFCF